MKRIFMILAAFGIFSTVAVNAQSTEEQTQPAEEQVQPSEDQTQPQDQVQPSEDQTQPQEQVEPSEDQEKPEAAEEGTMQENKKEIQFSELPEAVQTGFDDSEYAEWEVTKVYEVSGDEGTHYELTVSDGTNEQTVMLDEEGQIKENE